MPANYDNQSLSRAFKILECLGEAPEALGVAEVARRTGLHRATVHRLLSVLVQMGYVHKNAGTAEYSTAFYLHTLGYTYNVMASVVRHARRFLERIGVETGFAVHLAGFEGVQVVICDACGAAADLGPALWPVNARRDSHATAPGKALLALRPVEETRQRYAATVLARHTPRTINTMERLLPDLVRARQLGYAVDDEESRHGVRAVAAPIVNPAGRAICAISVDAPKYRLDTASVPALAARLTAAARDLADYIVHSDRAAFPANPASSHGGAGH